MIAVISAASHAGGPAGVAVLENVTPPPLRVRSPAARPVLIFTPPLTPAAPSWMWPMLIAVVAGQPVIVTSNFTDVGFKVTVAVPAQLASASAIAGTSFEDLSSALKTFATVGTGVGEAVGVGVDTAAVPPQAATRIAAAAMPANTRIFQSSLGVQGLYGRPHSSDDEAEQAYKHGFCRGRSSLSSGGHPPPLAAYPGTARATPSSPYMALLQVALARFTPHTRDRHCGAGLASRRRGVTPYLALWSPDFPRRLTPTRPSGLLSVFYFTALR